MKARVINHKILIGEMDDVIHSNHSIPTTLDEINEDVWSPFVVFEQVGNYPLVHGIMAASADEALQEVFDFLIEDYPEEVDSLQLSVEPLEF